MNERLMKGRMIAPVEAADVETPAPVLDEFCLRWAIAELALFGSLARGDAREDSDADVLVKFLPGTSRTFADRTAIESELRAILGRDVDLVEEELVVNPFRRHNILLDKKVLFPLAPAAEQVRDGSERFPRDLGRVWDIVRTARLVGEATEAKSREDYRAGWILRAAVERVSDHHWRSVSRIQ